ncbi:MAG: type II toxin-antitoxin system prevent-host-death family antitoxin [Rhodoferax sp.]|nr:type II toxin-antitoxin system prevent-host-death family antitoxin [Rhodoferax sp.]
MSVAIRELKASLSRVLSRAQSGEIIEVTSHNKPIARIIGIPEHAEPGLRGLIAGGAVSWGGGKPVHELPVALTARAPSVSQMVLEDRR